MLNGGMHTLNKLLRKGNNMFVHTEEKLMFPQIPFHFLKKSLIEVHIHYNEAKIAFKYIHMNIV